MMGIKKLIISNDRPNAFSFNVDFKMAMINENSPVKKEMNEHVNTTI